MSIFNDLGSTVSSAVESASAAVSGVTSNISNAITAAEGGIASGLSAVSNGLSGVTSGLNGFGAGLSIDGIVGGISSAFGGLESLLTSAVKPLAGVKLPLPNPLFDYASYTYNIGIAALTTAELNNPDGTYRNGKYGRLLCKSANAEPDNRPNTPYGKLDFYIQDLEFKTQIGMEEGNNSNMTGEIKFKVIEPYSMGMFFLACQQLAQGSATKDLNGAPEWGNWRDAPWLLIIEFRGNKETGQISTIPKANRYIPIQMKNFYMNVTQDGAVYDVVASVYNQAGLNDSYTKFQSDFAISGSTVQEMLQKGPKSLQAVMNKKLQDVADSNGIAQPDKILILFPSDRSSEGTATTGENTNGATVDVNAQQVYTKLGVTVVDGELIQSATATNKIGLASMAFDDTRKGDTPIGKDADVYDANGNLKRGKNTVNNTVTDMRFTQDTDITNAINQVCMQSSYSANALKPENITKEGYRTWWTVDVQLYPIGKENKATGEKPKLIVYRVLEYMVHNASGPKPPNVKPFGYPELEKQAVKEYNYIYTGKNVDILKFEIKFHANFVNSYSADGFSGTIDNKTAAQASGAEKDKKTRQLQVQSLPEGQPADTSPGVIGSAVKFVKTIMNTDKHTGGGLETQTVRSARLFHDTLTSGSDMMNLDLEIIGDPYFIVQSGQGNYSAKRSQYYNLCSDGSIDYQSGEVDIMVNFRTPVDINQGTGLYDFGKNNSSAPIKGFSGLYKVIKIFNTFKDGKFTQKLTCNRRNGYEIKTESTKAQIYADRTKVNPHDPNTGAG
jgi:hypothetical protein